jgi:hypothetical protein
MVNKNYNKSVGTPLQTKLFGIQWKKTASKKDFCVLVPFGSL